MTVAGTGRAGFGGSTYDSSNHGFAVESQLNAPWGLALDRINQRLYVADTLNNAVRSVDLETGLLETVAGTGEPGFFGEGSLAASAKLFMPTGLAIDVGRQMLYISDTSNHRVRAMPLRPGRVYQAEETSSASGAQAPASLSGPEALHTCPNFGVSPAERVTPLLMGSKFCSGSTGRGYAMYVNSIRDRIDFNVQATAGAGNYELRFRYADRHDAHLSGGRKLRLYVNGAVHQHDFLFRPTGVLQAGRRDVFGWAVATVVLQSGQNVVKLEVTGHGGPHVDHLYVVPPRPTISTVAGTGVAGPADDLATPKVATSSPLRSPIGLALDTTGQILYIADSDNGRVRRLDLGAGTISTIAGGSPGGSSRDGKSAKDGKLFRPVGLALDSTLTYLYVVDIGQDRLRRIDLTPRFLVGGTITTICGFGIRQAPFEMLLNAPHDLVLDEAANTILIADLDSSRIRVANLSMGMCPSQEASRLECAEPGMSAEACASLGCCFDAAHPDCANPWSPDKRVDVGFQPLDVLTRVDGSERKPAAVSFVEERSSRCCYPRLHQITTLELLDAPRGLAWDPEERAVYVSQPKRHRVMKLLVSESRCSRKLIRC